MATNLVSVVMQFLTPDMIAKIASVLGLDRNVAQKTIAGAIPALLASLADVASTPNGARQLTNTLTQQSDSLESLKNLVGGAGQNLWRNRDRTCSPACSVGTLDTMAQTMASSPGSARAPASRCSACLAPWFSAHWVSSSAAWVSMQAGWRRFSLRRRIRSPLPCRPVLPINRVPQVSSTERPKGCVAVRRRRARLAAELQRLRSGPFTGLVRRPRRWPAEQRYRNGHIGWSPRWYWVVSPGSPWSFRGGHRRSGVASLYDADRDRNRGHGAGGFDGRRDESGEPDQRVGWFHQDRAPVITDSARPRLRCLK